MTINEIYKKILESHEKQDISLLQEIILRICVRKNIAWFYLKKSNCIETTHKFIITAGEGLESCKSKIKRKISQDIFDWISNSSIAYHIV